MTLRRIIVLTSGAVAALAAVYGIAWFAIADQLRGGIDRWVAERRAEGWTAEHGDIAIGGFPLTWRAHVASPRLAQAARKPAFLWAGPSLDLSWRPWQARIVDFRTAGTHRLGIGTAEEARAAPLTMAQANGRLVFAADGGLRSVAFRIDDAALPARNGEVLRIGRIASAFNGGPTAEDPSADKPHLKAAVRLDTEISGMVLPAASKPALGRTIEKLGLRGAILGQLPNGNVKEMLSGWRDGGGTLEIDRLELGWSALRVQADGTMALDQRLQPVGALTARIAGYEQTMDRLVAAGAVRAGEALLAKFALGALARTPDGGGPAEITVPISIQEGWIYLGPVKLLPAPPLVWN
jgi:hypothetical protein